VRQPLTARQREALDFITHCLDERGYPPTLREIVREELKSRALRPVDFDDAKVTIPILGRVAAGTPILATETSDDRVIVDRFFLGAHSAREVFGLIVRGDSMIEDGIYDGDYIFVRKQSTAENGEIVVVMIEGEATCKRYYMEGERIRLQPANETMAPIYVHRAEFRSIDILGKVVGVYRRVG
jgi:repressor LexA